MIILIAVVSLLFGMIIGTAIQVAYPTHPVEMWRGLKAVLAEYVQGYKDINTAVKKRKQ